VPRVHVVEESSASPDEVLEAARDFTPRRAELWRDVHVEHMTIHDRGATWADVTEGNPWPVVGVVWERLRYDWSEDDALKGTVVDSNLFKRGSTWQLRATSDGEGGSNVEIVAVRHLRARGRLLWPFFPLGLARRDVAAYLRRFLDKVESTATVVIGGGCALCESLEVVALLA
jgi:polyketide cyclase/dehydrase/lipid transport protein